METQDWQTWVALGVVAMTMLLFIFRARRKQPTGCSTCGKDSDC